MFDDLQIEEKYCHVSRLVKNLNPNWQQKVKKFFTQFISDKGTEKKRMRLLNFDNFCLKAMTSSKIMHNVKGKHHTKLQAYEIEKKSIVECTLLCRIFYHSLNCIKPD